MIPIRVQNNFSWLETDDETLLNLFYKALRFQPPNWFHAQRRGRGSWSGWVSFFDKKKGKFPTGLLPEIEKALDILKRKYKIVDERPKIDLQALTVTSDIFGDIELYDYQVDLANICLYQKRGIVKAPTASGKTILFTSILKALSKQIPTICLFRNKSLVDQTYETFKKFNIENIGRVHGEVFEPALITCCTIQSLHKLADLVPHVKALIIDECHEFVSTQSVRTIKKFKNTVIRLGFSATPFKQNNPVHNYKLKSWIGPLLCDIPTLELQENGILSESIAHFYKISQQDGDAEEYPWPLCEDAGIVYNKCLNEKIVEIIQSIPEGRIMILVRRIPHGDNLHVLMPDAHWIRGQDNSDTRNYVLGQLRESKEKKVVAICSSICNVGVNVFIHHLINAAGGKEPNLTIQKMGRGLRKAEDKDHLEYHDFFHDTNYILRKHSKIRVKTLKKEGHSVIEHY